MLFEFEKIFSKGALTTIEKESEVMYNNNNKKKFCLFLNHSSFIKCYQDVNSVKTF